MPLDILDFLFLPMLFFIGIIVSWEDYRIGKIRNKWIFLGLIYGILVLVFLFLWSILADSLVSYIKLLDPDKLKQITVMPLNYFWQVGLNSFLALALGFMAWKLNLIASGDAKLFFLFTLLLPLKYYWQAYLPYFPSFTLLLNIVLPVFFFIFLQACWYGLKKLRPFLTGKLTIKKEQVVRILKREAWEFFKLFIGFAAIFLLIGKLRDLVVSWLEIDISEQGLLLIVFFILYRPLYAVLRKNKAVLIAALFILAFYVIKVLIYTPQDIIAEIKGMLIVIVSFMLLISIIRKIVNYYITNSTVKKINAEELKPGMRLMLVKPVHLKNRALRKALSQQQVENVKKWAQKNNLKQIKVYEKFPFAAWMLLGVVITTIWQKPIINVVIEIVKNIYK